MQHRTARGLILVGFVLLLILASPRSASAYVDPGSGAMIWQILAAACLSSLFYVRKVVRWVRQMFAPQSKLDPLAGHSPSEN